MSMQPAELKAKIRGVLHLVMTPFDNDEELDQEALRKGVRHSVNELKGEDVVFVALGSTGEFYAMSDRECEKVAEIVVEEVNGEFPVIVGTGRPGTRPTIETSQHAQSIGADGVMIVPPYYHLTTQEGIYRHYKKVADNLDIGIMVYNNLEVCKLYISPDLMTRLSKIDNIVADKENTPNVVGYYWMQKVIDPEDMVIVCGLGQSMYPFEALFGCPGYVTELSNFAPEVAVDIYKSAMAEDFAKLRDLTDKMAPYNQFIQRIAKKRGVLPTVLSPHLTIDVLPFYQAVCKEAMNLKGIPGGKARDPMENITGQEKEELRTILQNLGIL